MKIRCSKCFHIYDNERESVCPQCGFREDAVHDVLNTDALPIRSELRGGYQIGMERGRSDCVIRYLALQGEEIFLMREYFPEDKVRRKPAQPDVVCREYVKEEDYHEGMQVFYEFACKLENIHITGLEELTDIFFENNTVYVASRLIHGITLKEYMDKEKKLDQQAAEEIFFSLGDIVKQIHANHIIYHRLAPENIILGNDRIVYAADLVEKGILSGSGGRKETSDYRGFYAPECYENLSGVGQWSDVYSLGALLYYMLSGMCPREALDRKGRQRHLSRAVRHIPKYIDRCIQRAMAHDRSLRFLKVQELLDVMETQTKVRTPGQEYRRRNRKKRMGMTALLSVIGIGAASCVILWQVQKAYETLPEAELTVWYQKTGNAEMDYEKECAYLETAKRFQESFPTVAFHLEAIPEAEMGERLLTASVSGEMPDLFESDGQEALLSQLAGSVEGVIGKNSSCLFLTAYKSKWESCRQIPLGFSVPVIYANTALITYDGAAVNDLEELKLKEGKEASLIACSSGLLDECLLVFGASEKLDQEKDIVDFYNEEVGYLFADTRNYHDVRMILPAWYSVKSIHTETLGCTPGAFWSLSSELTDEEKKAAVRFLKYCLSDSAQDILFLQHESQWLPINKAALTAYSDVYSEMKPVIDPILQQSQQYMIRETE